MSRMSSLQDPFLNALRKERISVSIYLVNGIKLQGQVESFDQFVIVLNNNNINQMVYKHAVSTIVPSSIVTLQFKQSNDNKTVNEPEKKINDIDDEDLDSSVFE